mmetsp:Transcript_20195/g.37756  ORF Transcript_20195/g.37756 Transcript_20195/m.37756 type:complete len:201 (-) Transcript_20195:559-1161(-)
MFTISLRSFLIITRILSVLDKTQNTFDLPNDAFVVEQLDQRLGEWKSFGYINGIIDRGRNAGFDERNLVHYDSSFQTQRTKPFNARESTKARFFHTSKGKRLNQIIRCIVVDCQHASSELLSNGQTFRVVPSENTRSQSKFTFVHEANTFRIIIVWNLDHSHHWTEDFLIKNIHFGSDTAQNGRFKKLSVEARIDFATTV